MKTTKKQINEVTQVVRGRGFNPGYGYSCTINGISFNKTVLEIDMYVDEEDEYGRPITIAWATVNTKKEFVNEVYDYIERIKDR